jgi:hypothetical protein
MNLKIPVLPKWTLLVVVVMAMQGFAQAASDPLNQLGVLGGFTDYLEKPLEWLVKFWKLITDAKVPEIALVTAGAILLFGVVWSGYRMAAGTFTGENPYMFMMRLAVAGFLVFPGSAGNVSRYVRETWQGSMAWGFESFAAPTVKEAGNTMKVFLDHASTVGGIAVGGGALAGAGKAAIAVRGATTAARTATAIQGAGVGAFKTAGNVTNMTKAVGFLAMPIFMTYYVIILITGFTVLISSIMLPISGAMLIFPGSMGTEWFSRWLKATLSALFLIAFIPLVFAVALNVGFITPTKAYSDKFEEASTKISKQWNKKGGINLNPLQKAQEAISGLKVYLKETFNIVVNFVLGFLMMLIGIIAGVAVIGNAYSQITAFIGGAISASGAAGSGMMMSRALSVAGAGGGSPSGSGSPKGGAGSPKGGGDKGKDASPSTPTAGGPGGGSTPQLASASPQPKKA